MFTKLKQRGFTLIELLIVITIIGILAAALLPSILGAPARARDAARKAHLNSLITAIEIYNNDNQLYPEGQVCVGAVTGADTVLDQYFQGNTPVTDPQKGNAKAVKDCEKGTYYYCRLDGNPANYMVAAYMEQANDGNGVSSTLLAGDACHTNASTGDINAPASFAVTGQINDMFVIVK